MISNEAFCNILDDLGESAVFSEREIKLYSGGKNAGRYAARYLLKEMIRKEVCREAGLCEIEILNNEAGCPELILDERYRIKLQEIGIHSLHISLSHTKARATALLIIERDV